MATVNQVSFPIPQDIDCPKCRENIKLFDPEGSEFCACPSCKSFIRFTLTSTKGSVQKQVQPVKEKPIIPLGAEGVLKGHRFKVIAYLEKKEKDTIYAWKEYLLYNFIKGYATLAVFNGHWSFIVNKTWEPTLEKSFSDAYTATHQNVEYRIFNRYTPVTTALIGEFDWDVLDDKPKTNEYIAPPYLLSRESDSPGSKKAQYFWGEYIEADEIAEAFGLDVNTFPSKEGIGANQPSPHSVRFDTLAKYTVLAILGMFLLHFIITVLKPEKELINKDFYLTFDKGPATTDSAGNVIWGGEGTYEFKPFKTTSFSQPDESTALEVEVRSFVSNNWLEATVVLVNDKTNETWEVTKGIEYYHGWEDGESWAEGSQSSSIILSEIPRGDYHFNIYTASGDAAQSMVQIKVVSNVTLWRNILLTILVLSLYPIYCWYRMRNFEKKRWMNSDHSPYETE